MVTEGDLIGGRYRILTQVGAGGMSTVYLAMDASLHRPWAVKQMRGVATAERRDVVKRSLTVEAEMISRLDHPAIPRIVDLVEERNDLFVVMDYVEGRTLSAVLEEQGPQSESQVVDWGIQLCDVLDYLHRRTPMVVFRDMKPSNVMVMPDGAIRLIDFGIAVTVGVGAPDRPALGDTRPLGTPGYGAPEQFEEHGTVDARTDIYALGATLFHLLTGVHPRSGMTPIRRVRPGLAEGLEQTIAKATAVDPDRRYRTCAEFAYALGHCAESEAARRTALLGKWRLFIGAVVACMACLALSGTSLAVAGYERNGDFTHWLRQAEQTTDLRSVEQACEQAARIKPGSMEPYLHLIDRYMADGVFSRSEERTYVTLLNRNADALRSDAVGWAELCYGTGRLYWYYYGMDAADAADADAQRLTRIRAAAPWMRNAADVETFDDSTMAGIYADIAEFNVRIVPMINEGSDVGRYRPYFTRLRQLIDAAATQNSEVIRLEAANLVLDALLVYPRKFRADGVSRSRMTELCDDSEELASATRTTAIIHDESRQRALRHASLARDAVMNAFIDIKGDDQ